MTNDLRAAAERLRRHWDADESCRPDEIALAKAYLAEHPAGDGEPVTAEWLAEVLGHPVQPICGDWEWLIVSVALKNEAETLWPFHKRKWVKMPFEKLTRGQTLRLLVALASITAAT